MSVRVDCLTLVVYYLQPHIRLAAPEKEDKLSLSKNRLNLLTENASSKVLLGITRGIEKESLRVTKAGRIAKTPHSKLLGAALTHPQITTDFSEALLLFIKA